MRAATALLDFDLLDRLGDGSSAIHHLDPRAKLLTVLVFIVTVVSYPKHTVAGLLPLLLFPLAVAVLGRLPMGYLAGKLLLVAPFVLLVGIANPMLDREPMLLLGPLAISGGWISFCSILLRAVLTAGAGLVLIGVTSFRLLCAALQRLGTPRLLTTQLLLVYRYLFVLGEEGRRLARARRLRSFGRRGKELAVHRQLVGSLLLRTVDRARRIHQAMLARGFDGTFPSRPQPQARLGDALFFLGWSSFFVICRVANLPHVLGSWVVQAAS